MSEVRLPDVETRRVAILTLYDVECPYCGSGEDEPCRTSPGDEIRTTPHVLRRRAFQVAKR